MEYKLIIGVDVSKQTLDMTALDGDSVKGRHKCITNNSVGYVSLLKWLSELGVELEDVLVCMEHTGYYIFGLCKFLQSNAITYGVVNPLQIKKSMGIQRVKTDKRDSKVIALYASKFREDLPIGNIPEKELLDIKLLSSHRERLLRQKLSIEKVTEELSSTLGKKEIGHIVKDNEVILKLLTTRLKKTEEKIVSIISSSKELKSNYELMQSIPGVGPQIALYVLINTHNFDRIDTARKFGCFAGVVPNSRESGTSIRGRSRVSSIANKKMKSLLHFGAMTAVRRDGELKAYYERKVNEGKSKMSVLNAVRNKMVHRIYSVVKRGTPYFTQHVINNKTSLVLS